MSFIAFASFAAAAYFTARPFVKLRFLKKDIEDDLGDYYRGVNSFGQPLLDIMLVLQKNGLFDGARREGLEVAYRALVSIESWDDVARADRLVVEAFDEAVRVLNESGVEHCAECYRSARIRFNTTDEKMIETRRLLHRDIPILNRSFVHKSRFLARLVRVPTYPMSEPIQWYAHREPSGPREWYIYRASRGLPAPRAVRLAGRHVEEGLVQSRLLRVVTIWVFDRAAGGGGEVPDLEVFTT